MLIKPYEPERKGAMIALPDMVQQRMNMVDNRAVVVEVGLAAWHDEPQPRAKAGDRVLVTKFAGFAAKGPADGEMYRLVNDRDVFCAITVDADAEFTETTASRLPLAVSAGVTAEVQNG